MELLDAQLSAPGGCNASSLPSPPMASPSRAGKSVNAAAPVPGPGLGAGGSCVSEPPPQATSNSGQSSVAASRCKCLRQPRSGLAPTRRVGKFIVAWFMIYLR